MALRRRSKKRVRPAVRSAVKVGLSLLVTSLGIGLVNGLLETFGFDVRLSSSSFEIAIFAVTFSYAETAVSARKSFVSRLTSSFVGCLVGATLVWTGFADKYEFDAAIALSIGWLIGGLIDPDFGARNTASLAALMVLKADNDVAPAFANRMAAIVIGMAAVSVVTRYVWPLRPRENLGELLSSFWRNAADICSDATGAWLGSGRPETEIAAAVATLDKQAGEMQPLIADLHAAKRTDPDTQWLLRQAGESQSFVLLSSVIADAPSEALPHSESEVWDRLSTVVATIRDELVRLADGEPPEPEALGSVRADLIDALQDDDLEFDTLLYATRVSVVLDQYAEVLDRLTAGAEHSTAAVT